MTATPSRPRRRDPRASSPLRFRRNVSVPETCAFYGSADAISSCRVPRATLLRRLPRQAHVSVDARVAALTRRVASQAPVVRIDSHAQWPVFFSENATYCGVSDAACALCRREFASVARTNRSMRESLRDAFCMGDHGRCVCTGVCEVPEYRATMEQDYNCNAPMLYYVAGHTLPSFTSRRRDPRAPLLPMKESSESCAYYNRLDVRGCRRPRLASDCLEKMGCMISYSEGCVEAQYPATNLANVTAIPIDLHSLFGRYVAGNTTICASTNTNCSSCSADIDRVTQGRDVNSSRVRCVGSSACLCEALVAYHDNKWQKSRHDPDCPLLLVNPYQVLVSVAVGFVTFMLLVGSSLRYAVVRSRLREVAAAVQGRAARVMRHMLDNAPGGLDLDLFGWRRYHRTLRQKEERLLQGEENVSPVAGPMDLHSLWSPSAPDFEATEASTAPDRNDPMALASAPCFRGEDDHDSEQSARSSIMNDHE